MTQLTNIIPQDLGAPIGVFSADTAEAACQAAARKRGSVGTFFALEGTPWGIEMNQVDGVEELGVEDVSQQTAMARRIADLEHQLQIGK